MRDKVTIGVIGTGFGQLVHVPAFRSCPGCEVRAIAASRLEHAQQAAQALGVPRSTADWRELVSDPELDGLALAVPPSVQAEIALAAARAGKHLFCEKPLALNAAQAEEIAAAARQSGIVHALDFIFPEIPAWQLARESIQSSKLGRIRHAALTWRVETYAYRASVRNWKMSPESGGGTLNNFASHTFYYLEWLFGPIVKVQARLSPPGQANSGSASQVEARVDAWVDFAAGFPCAVSISADAFLGFGHRLEVYGDHGTCVLENTTADYARGFNLFLGTRESPHLDPVAVIAADAFSDGRIYPVSRIAARFVDAIRDHTKVLPGFDEGVRTQVLLDALRLADRTGTWQDVRLS